MDIRPSPIAGKWYPAHPERLARDIDRYLADARPCLPPGSVVGIVAPHAGLRYSGPVAAWAYACVRGLHPEVVAVVGPLHDDAPAGLLTSAHDAYATPLGPTPIDRAAVGRLDAALRERLGEGLAAQRGDAEHAIEIELPFLQRVLGEFRLLPVMVRDQRPATTEALGRALAATLRGRPALLVASSDLSHYRPQRVAERLDAELLRRVAALDPPGVLSAEDEGAGYACGAGALAATLWAARELGADQVDVLRYATSGDVTGDYGAVVGYGAAVIWQTRDA
jgi:AmmeMemoRadiSam system protein B